jgi:hypothetical protein
MQNESVATTVGNSQHPAKVYQAPTLTVLGGTASVIRGGLGNNSLDMDTKAS